MSEIDVSLETTSQTIDVSIDSGGFVLTPATRDRLGGVIVGDNINVTSNGTISVPDASDSVKGVIEIATDEEATAGASETLAVTPKQLSTKQDVLVSGTNIKTINNESMLGNGNIDIDSLPNQSGENGKFLTTNGTVASWANVPVSSVNNKTGAVTLSASDVGALPDSTHIPADPVQSNWDEENTESLAYIQNKPTIPAAQVNSDWNANSGVAEILNKPSLAAVATSGAYSDLTGTPTIPTVGNGTITIAQGGISKGTFTVNQSGDTTINLDSGGGGGTDLPDQTGHSGEFLTTNGTAASWASAPVTSVNSKTGAVTLSASDVGALPDSTVIPAAQVNSDWDAASGVAQILNKPTLGTAASASTTDFATAAQGILADTAVQPGDLATVATSGNYNDLSNKPTIPTVYNATLTIQKNGTTVKTFTANASTNVTANITVPTDTSDLSNGAGFITGISSGDVTSALGYTPVNPSSLASVATSGSYADLSNKPTIPTVNNATLTITQGGVSKGTFTANASTDVTIALDSGGSGTDLPDQTGHSGEFLTTNGTSASWGAVPVTSVNSKTGAVTLTASDVSALPDSTVIPTVNDATITITQGGVTKGSFTLNQSSGDTIALDAGSGSTEIEWATYGTTTYQQVSDWVSAGKEVLCIRSNVIYRLMQTNGVSYIFTSTTSGGVYSLYVSNADLWSNGVAQYEPQFRNSVMPTAGSAYNNKIYQYTGTTDANYTNGYFYKCVSDGGVPATYSWVQTDVQPVDSHRVIAFQAPSAQNNYTWYRKYADGWVEQGGISTANTSAVHTVTLPIEMADTNYTVLTSLQSDTVAGSGGSFSNGYAASTTQIGLVLDYSTTWVGTGCYWTVYGIAA